MIDPRVQDLVSHRMAQLKPRTVTHPYGQASVGPSGYQGSMNAGPLQTSVSAAPGQGVQGSLNYGPVSVSGSAGMGMGAQGQAAVGPYSAQGSVNQQGTKGSVQAPNASYSGSTQFPPAVQRVIQANPQLAAKYGKQAPTRPLW